LAIDLHAACAAGSVRPLLAPSERRPRRRRLREPVNGLTHLFGAALAAAGLVALVAAGGDALRTTAFAIYGASLVLLYLASSAYHLLPLSPRGVARLRRFDHLMVFVLIAGTYTPVSLLALEGAWGWAIFGGAWGLALLGFAQAFLWMDAPRWLSTGLYLAAGWVGLVAIVPLARTLPAAGVFHLFAGGVVYSLGAVVYARKRPDPWPGRFGFHELWHLFVLGGSAFHYAMMWTL
jgi:hemolysin III